MRGIILCTALLLASSPGYAQAPSPPVPPPSAPTSLVGATTVPENGLVQLTVSPSPTSVAWLVMPDVSQFATGSTLVFAGPAGSYTVVALAIVAAQPVILKTTVTITSASQAQPLAIAIFDPSTLTSLPAGQVAIYQSTTIGPALAQNGVVWLQYQIGDVIPSKGGSTPLSSTTWGTAALQAGLPSLVTSTNGVVSAIPLPATQAALIQQLGNLTRGK
jgi:hypothetical protein